MNKYLLAWYSDLHFDFIPPLQRQRFLDSVAMSGANGVVITGDISTSRRIADSLGAIAGMGLPTYFVTGNHDYYAGNFVATDATIASVCRQFPNLTRLGLGEIIPLGERTVLIGHSGWGDGRAGMGPMTPVRMNDSLLIADLRLEGAALFEKLAELGMASARYIESVASVAVQNADQVVVATHSPLIAAVPNAVIYEVGGWGLRSTAWQDLELVRDWQAFLDAAQRYLRHVVD